MNTVTNQTQPLINNLDLFDFIAFIVERRGAVNTNMNMLSECNTIIWL